ncbi:hypothetical protein EPUS_07191 [Endocarpon pusillum Z07020]|uniref:DUF1750-domain-containing protein n=1 Tax=Endocarpon pusillum (strain Z07020 / HMAS-L-300199) TaxID=1263415 RepID=U1HF09_ENDPU|nr:uncharacterized protein EPUS_07191 [Endocarpon pusillum Z07020]ERF68630.1 hypothetical protein EPUS_07191 [Endocarpon pusillum Z07020]
MQQPLRDPAAGVARELLPHLHLVSKYRYPFLNQMSLDTVVSYLTEAPKIVHDLQPVVWQFLEAPPDGTVLLVWQPLDYLGANFASDGYVWGDAEHAFNSEHNGYMVEMWLHRGGYHWPNEPFTAHCRKRYRLTQSKNSNAPPCDPSLWIIHYSRADRENVIPSSQLPLQPNVQTALSQRRFLQSQGHLARKEFMLHDKANWPTINMPSSQGLQYPPHMIARQQAAAAAAAQIQMGAAPIKSVPERNQHRRGPSNALEPTLEEEEDVSRGDMLDFMTPREISRMRYEQHHEWMEEIMSSPFAMKQILPTDLGLGRKGELEALTSGFFDTPTSVLQETPANASRLSVGRMEVAKAEEFTAKAAKKVAEMEAELEHLKKRHARRMAKLDRSLSLVSAEKKLRAATAEGGQPSTFGNSEAESGQRATANIDDIVRDVETASGKKIKPVSAVECVQKGGLEERLQTPTAVISNRQPTPENAIIENKTNNSNTEASNTTETRVSPEAEQLQHPSANAPQTSQSVTNGHRPENQPPAGEETTMEESTVPSLDDMDVDIEMAGLDHDDRQVETQTVENEGSEWVMVDDLNADIRKEDAPGLAEAQIEVPEPVTERAGPPAASDFAHSPTAHATQGLTPAEPSGGQLGEGEDMNTADFDLGQGGFDANLDDTGHDLVDFGDEHGDLNLEGMDDSAFGDAFHPPDEDQSHLLEHGDMS